jgi:hypothetical protein
MTTSPETATAGDDIFPRRYESSGLATAPIELVFVHLDDHERLSEHMTQPSWKMGGGHMAISVDAGRFRSVGSRLRLSGRVFGIMLNVEEVIVDHHPPYKKTWETIGEPRLLVIGRYRMTFELTPRGTSTVIRVSIDYERPTRGFPRLLGVLFAGYYARWCTRRMVTDAAQHFAAR